LVGPRRKAGLESEARDRDHKSSKSDALPFKVGSTFHDFHAAALIIGRCRLLSGVGQQNAQCRSQQSIRLGRAASFRQQHNDTNKNKANLQVRRCRRTVLRRGMFRSRNRIINIALIPRALQAAVYGKCIVADYNSVHQDKCLNEFLRLKDCYLVSTLAF
jgi:hypothetical protein